MALIALLSAYQADLDTAVPFVPTSLSSTSTLNAYGVETTRAPLLPLLYFRIVNRLIATGEGPECLEPPSFSPCSSAWT